MLIKARADVDLLDNDGKSVWMYHNEGRAIAILESGADFNANTALFHLLSKGYFRAADKLLQRNPIIEDIDHPKVRLALPIIVAQLKRQ